MRRGARDLLKHPHKMELADRSGHGKVIQVQRLFKMFFHVANDPFNGHLVSLNGIGAVAGRYHTHALMKFVSKGNLEDAVKGRREEPNSAGIA
jgi:hypothetical protein